MSLVHQNFNTKLLHLVQQYSLTKLSPQLIQKAYFRQKPFKRSIKSTPRKSLRNLSKILALLFCGTLVGSGLDISENVLPCFKISDAVYLTGRREQFNFIADVADIAAPSVVYIEIRDSRRFNFLTGKPASISNGSGFIIGSDGLILTNAHVIVDQTLRSNVNIMVKLADGRSFDGVVESIDRISDLGTVRINCKNLPIMRLGTSGSLKSGEWVVALGSPLALSKTVTCGIISAHRKSDELGLRSRKIYYIQTDAAINDGNSGGPLMNLNGEVIGVNSMKVLPGISFAIPIDHVKSFLKGIKKVGSGYRPDKLSMRYLGIRMLTLTEDLIAELKRSSKRVNSNLENGVLIWKVIPFSPAEESGLHPGDIVTHINGKEVKSSADVYDVLSEKGKSLDMTIYRGLKQMRIVVKPED